MNECLVTKLKGTVDNSNLPVYGEMYIDIVNAVASDEFTINLGSTPGAFTIRIIGNTGTILANGTTYTNTYTFPGGGSHDYCTVSNITGNAKIGINLKYIFDVFELNTERYGTAVIDPEQLYYNINTRHNPYGVGFHHVKFSNGELKINKLREPRFTMYDNNYSDNVVSYNIDDDDYKANRLSICVIYSYANPIPAEKLYLLPNLADLRYPIVGNIKYLADTKLVNSTGRAYLVEIGRYQGVTGSIEELVSYARSKGYESGRIGIEFITFFNNVTYQGTALNTHTEITAGSSNYVSWDSQGNITVA